MERTLLGSSRGRLAAGIAAGAVGLAALTGCGQQARQADDNLVAGKQAFVEKCGACHTLSRAGTRGTNGPNLDVAFQRAVADGFGRSTVRGVVHQQILYPSRGSGMPAKLVEGDAAEDVAAYVATVAARSGEDEGLLATAVKPAGSGRPIAAEDGVLQIDADPGGQLAYVTREATAEAGELTLRMQNEATVPHDLDLEADGAKVADTEVVSGGATVEAETTVEPGRYTFYCSVQGHRQAGMEGTLTVR